jgi:hypothetical protein
LFRILRVLETGNTRHLDLIFSVLGNCAEGCPPGAIEVTTADGQVHPVTAESDDASRSPPNLLSQCVPSSAGTRGEISLQI